jgi:hypothetical protein
MTLCFEMLANSAIRACSHLGDYGILSQDQRALAAKIGNSKFSGVITRTANRLLVASCECRKIVT